MTTRVRKSFIDNLKSQDWMDKNTKDKAREKVRVTPAMGGRGTDAVEQTISYFTVIGVSKQLLLFALIIDYLRSAKCFFHGLCDTFL